ncbi:MAG: hypothetical protein WAO95_10240 [Burkholderiales bacterium]
MLKKTAIALAALAASAAAAQVPARPDPADPKAGGAIRPTYESAFKGYRPYADPAIARWRTSNEEAGRLGGHMGHVPQAPGGYEKPEAKPHAPGAHGGQK